MTDRYAVVGNPIGHSKSPLIHAEFARQTGQDLSYEALLAPLDGFVATIEHFFAAGGKGLNVTVPFKQEAWRFATPNISVRAAVAQAVNTLKLDASGQIFGDNTDGLGLVRDLMVNLNFPLKGKRILLMGAGGAARGVLLPLLLEQPSDLVVANRTPQKARDVIELINDHLPVAQFNGFDKAATHMTASNYDDLNQKFDLVINATSASLSDALPPLPEGVFAPDSLAYDMMYGKGLTPFLEFARQQGAARLADGLGMLVEQAAESFFLWRGARPDTAPVIELLKSR